MNLGEAINTRANERSAALSRDGHYLRVVSGEAQDQFANLPSHRRAPTWTRIYPTLRHEAAMPGQQCRRRDDEGPPAGARHDPAGRCQKEPVGPRHPRAAGSSPEDREFVPEDDDFQFLEIVRANTQGRKLRKPAKHRVNQREKHGAFSVARVSFYAGPPENLSVSRSGGRCHESWINAPFTQWRAFVLACTLMDTGIRIEEALGLRKSDLDFDNLLLKVRGKGQKERLVSFSFELRRVLFRWVQMNEQQASRSEWVFATRAGTRLGQRNALRAHYALLARLGIPKSGFHRLRHTFATNYLQHGGDVVRLSRVLGHSQITTTMRYLHLLTTDLQQPHQQLSILNRLR